MVGGRRRQGWVHVPVPQLDDGPIGDPVAGLAA